MWDFETSIVLFAVAFAEASFSPVPPDAFLIPLAVYRPDLSLFYAAITTAASVLGGMFGYALGSRGGRPLIERFVDREKLEAAERYFSRYGVLAVGIAGFTPIPYKIFTILSGIMKLDFGKFVAVSLVSRGARFFLEAGLASIVGAEVIEILNIGAGIAVLGFLIAVAVWFAVKRIGGPGGIRTPAPRLFRG